MSAPRENVLSLRFTVQNFRLQQNSRDSPELSTSDRNSEVRPRDLRVCAAPSRTGYERNRRQEADSTGATCKKDEGPCSFESCRAESTGFLHTPGSEAHVDFRPAVFEQQF
jgi:hypothetical protein